MIDIALNQQTKDLRIINFDLVLIDEAEQITQNLLIRLKFFLGEWFFDTTQGIPYYEQLFIKSPNRISVDSILKDEIQQTEGIAKILSYESEYDASQRIFSVKFEVETISGEILRVEDELI